MEYLDILNEDGQSTGVRDLKDRVKQNGHWHRVVNLWIVNPQGDILQMKRAPGLTYFPNFWGTVGGHVQAGEHALDAVVRETLEELGISLNPQDLTHIFTDKAEYPWKDKTLRVFRDVYTTVWSGSLMNILLDPREAQQVSWFSRKELQNRYLDKNSEVFPLPQTYLDQLWCKI